MGGALVVSQLSDCYLAGVVADESLLFEESLLLVDFLLWCFLP